MSLVTRIPGVATAVLVSGALCFGAAYLGGTLTRTKTPVVTDIVPQAAAHPPAIPSGRVRPLASAEQIPGLRVPPAGHHRPAAPPAATTTARAALVSRAAAPGRSTPVRAVTRRPAAPAARPQPVPVVNRPTQTPTPPASAPTPTAKKPAPTSRPATSKPLTFFDDGGN
jgi:hypothetical protein